MRNPERAVRIFCPACQRETQATNGPLAKPRAGWAWANTCTTCGTSYPAPCREPVATRALERAGQLRLGFDDNGGAGA